MSAPKLVIGANGFLGSHVTRQLVAAGADVRAMVRPTANTRSIDDLDVTRFHGDVFDTATVREAMEGCDEVVLLRRRHPGLAARPVTAVPHQRRGTAQRPRRRRRKPNRRTLKRFVFTSTYATVGRRHGHVATEDDQINRRSSPPMSSRGSRPRIWCCGMRPKQGLPAVAMCVSTTYGAGDWGRTPHGAFIAGAVFGKLPF